MYYRQGPIHLVEQNEAPSSGMGFVPAILGAVAALTPVVAGLFQKKPTGPRGPSRAELELQAQAIAAQEAAAKRKQQLIIVGIIGAVGLAGIGAYLITRKKG